VTVNDLRARLEAVLDELDVESVDAARVLVEALLEELGADPNDDGLAS
jgi:hypothetical protein